MSNDKIAAFYVTLHGEVQGIGLRKRIREAARERDLKGWVRNRKAGHVQLHVEGPEPQARQLIADLQTGAITADIDDIVVTRTEPAGFEAFTVAKLADAPRIAPSLSRAALDRARRLEGEYADLNTTALALLKAGGDQSELADLLLHIPSQFLSETLLRKRKTFIFPLEDVICSFSAEHWSNLAFTSALHQSMGYTPGSILNEKNAGRSFVQRLGVSTPRIYQHNTPLEKIDFQPGTVLKPVSGSGSRGVFIIHDEGRIFDVKRRNWLRSYGELNEAANYDIELNKVRDRWSIEEFIHSNGGAARDIKVYCFYGNAPLILEVDRNGEGVEYCWWSRDRETIETGKYDKARFPGSRFESEYISTAEHISTRIPAPFIRIDFFRSDNGPVFGEFTPRPGGFHEFNAATDAWLGREFVEARARLMADIMKGKRFTDFEAFVAELRGSSAA